MSVRLVPKSVTLNDLEGLNGIIALTSPNRGVTEFGRFLDGLRRSG